MANKDEHRNNAMLCSRCGRKIRYTRVHGVITGNHAPRAFRGTPIPVDRLPNNKRSIDRARKAAEEGCRYAR